MIYGFGDPRNTKVSEQSANLCSANPSLWHPSLPPLLLFAPSVFLPAPFLPSSPRSRWHHPFGAPSHPHPRRGGDTFRRGTVPLTRGSRKFLSRSRNYNYPLGYARYAASRCAREADLQRSCLRRDVCLPPLRSNRDESSFDFSAKSLAKLPKHNSCDFAKWKSSSITQICAREIAMILWNN